MNVDEHASQTGGCWLCGEPTPRNELAPRELKVAPGLWRAVPLCVDCQQSADEEDGE